MSDSPAQDEALDLQPDAAFEEFSKSSASHGKKNRRSAAGKDGYRLNAVTHGCPANTLIIDGESQQDYDALYHTWMLAYAPESGAEAEMVERIITAKWIFARNERRFDEVEAGLAGRRFPDWSDQDHKLYQLALRYKTAAERSVTRAMNELESYRSNRNRETQHLVKVVNDSECRFHKKEKSFEKNIEKAEKHGIDTAEERAELAALRKQKDEAVEKARQSLAGPPPPQSRAQALFQGQYHPKKMRKIAVLDQWIEITVQDGKTVTTLHPSNEQLIKRGQRMYPPPELVYRRFNFVHGVPEEYHWCISDPVARKNGGFGTQRMKVDTWLDVIDREKLREDGHVGPTGVGNLPRSQERGGCDCPTCTQNRQILENQKQDQA
ncbi:MAG: hypothetical protein JOZ62_07330 [Acidobacteriaceae bacterium]|nr:hypothetical protein [Acidobacteriaceae bacterium]